MTAIQLKDVINQLEKYNLIRHFNTKEELNKWLIGLTPKQIKNFLRLNINPQDVAENDIGKILIYKNILSCEEYPEIIKAIIELKRKNPHIKFSRYYTYNPHLYDDLKRLLNLNPISDKDGFLFSLMVLLENKEFINSPYHSQDLELIIREINNQSKAAELLMELASDYCSLKDTYHLANMQILSENPVSVDFLFNLMTIKTIINGQYYQNEIAALYVAPSLRHTMAIYIFITGDIRSCINQGLIDDYTRTQLYKPHLYVSNNKIPNYITILNFLNTLPESIVLPISFIIKNINFVNNPYFDFDINFLQEINDLPFLVRLCKLVTNPNFVSSPYHIQDLQIIREIGNEKIRKLLFEVATSTPNINSPYHMYDMAFIARYDYSETFDENSALIEEIRKLILTDTGLNDQNHIKKLEKIYRGEYALDCNNQNTKSHKYIYPIFAPYSTFDENIKEDEVSHYANTLKENPNLLRQPKKTLLTRVRERFKK